MHSRPQKGERHHVDSVRPGVGVLTGGDDGKRCDAILPEPLAQPQQMAHLARLDRCLELHLGGQDAAVGVAEPVAVGVTGSQALGLQFRWR